MPLRDIIVTVPESGLRVAPSSIRLAESEVELSMDNGGDFVLREMVDEVRKTFDFVVIDTPPNIGRLTKGSLCAAHTAVIPCQTERFSLMGMGFLLDNIGKTRRRMNTSLSVLGIIPTIYKKGERNDRETLAEIQEQYGQHMRVFPPVPKSSTYAQATTIGRAALEAAPDVPGAAVYQEVAEALIQERETRLKTEIARVA